MPVSSLSWRSVRFSAGAGSLHCDGAARSVLDFRRLRPRPRSHRLLLHLHDPELDAGLHHLRVAVRAVPGGTAGLADAHQDGPQEAAARLGARLQLTGAQEELAAGQPGRRQLGHILTELVQRGRLAGPTGRLAGHGAPSPRLPAGARLSDGAARARVTAGAAPAAGAGARVGDGAAAGSGPVSGARRAAAALRAAVAATVDCVPGQGGHRHVLAVCADGRVHLRPGSDAAADLQRAAEPGWGRAAAALRQRGSAAAQRAALAATALQIAR